MILAGSPVDFPIDLFHLGPALRAILDGISAIAADRDILITNQNAHQVELTQILATQTGQEAAISSTGAQLSANIAAVNSALNDKIDSLEAAITALGATLSAQIDTFNAKADNLLTLLEAMIQAFQGTATLDLQNQMIALLTEITRATSPERPVSIGVDLTHVTTRPQPIPSDKGP